MSERESSPWASPGEKPTVSYEQRLQDAYGDLENPDDLDDMKVIFNPENVAAETAGAPSDSEGGFSVGETVNVRRTSGEIEDGWAVVENNASRTRPDGTVITGVTVEKKLSNDEVMTKFITVDALREVNAEREPIDRAEVQEEIAKEALEASGVVNPSEQSDEIDEHAKQYSRDEIRAMREASRRTVGDVEEGAREYSAEDQENDRLSALDRIKQGLSADDVQYLESYARYEQDKRDAQRDGDGAGSRSAQEGMGWAMQRMSEAAKQIRNQFSHAYNTQR